MTASQAQGTSRVQEARSGTWMSRRARPRAASSRELGKPRGEARAPRRRPTWPSAWRRQRGRKSTAGD
eukprot:2585780-Alexandrium_andersonii.AAC.1